MRVLAYIAAHLDKAGLYAHADSFTGRKVDLSRPTIGRVINDLREHGFLTVLVSTEKKADGKQTIRVAQVTPKGYEALTLSTELSLPTNLDKNRAHETEKRHAREHGEKPCSMDIVNHHSSTCRDAVLCTTHCIDMEQQDSKTFDIRKGSSVPETTKQAVGVWTPDTVVRLYEETRALDVTIAANIAASFWKELKNGQVVYPAQVEGSEQIPVCACGRVVDYNVRDLRNGKVQLLLKPECGGCFDKRQLAERRAAKVEQERAANLAAKALYDADTAREQSLRENAKPLSDGYLSSDQYRTSCGMTYLTDTAVAGLPLCDCGKRVYYEFNMTARGGMVLSVSGTCLECGQAVANVNSPAKQAETGSCEI